jgi:hypothetical protein
MNDIEAEVTHENNESTITARRKVTVEITVEPMVSPEDEELVRQITKVTVDRIHAIVNGYASEKDLYGF